jgi:hypothetical protein
MDKFVDASKKVIDIVQFAQSMAGIGHVFDKPGATTRLSWTKPLGQAGPGEGPEPAAIRSPGLPDEKAPGSRTPPHQREIDLGPALAPHEVPDIAAPGERAETRAPRLREIELPAGESRPRGRRRQVFGEPSTERGGTEARKGAHFHEYNASEVAHGVRVDYDRGAGRPRQVTYRIDRDAVQDTAQSKRGFTRDAATEGAQSSNSAYTNSGWERGHLVQREAMKGDIDVERSADHWTVVVPMSPELNHGAGSPWRASEQRAVGLAREHGSVVVEVRPTYEANPPRLSDGTPIPKEISRTIKSTDGRVLHSRTFSNYR